LNTFNEFGLADPILKALTAQGHSEPTKIQAQVIPTLLEKRDIIGIAQTGTGKTGAFLLPLLDRLSRNKPSLKPRGCTNLILSPTRELASQIAESALTYGKFMNISVTVIVGGVKPSPQIKRLRNGSDLVVATPGRLLDHMSSGAIDLSAVETIVIDEADQMFDLGFLPAVKRIIAKLPKSRQTVLMSATMAKPIRELALNILTNPVEIAAAVVSRPIERIQQSVIHVEAVGKKAALTKILQGEDITHTIVFTRTKRGADQVAKHLTQAGIQAMAIHGNKSQSQRERTLAAFKTGECHVLVATDIAARGIDIDDVSHVVNFELPNVPESYVHRIGRTARAGKNGTAVSLCDATEITLLKDIEKLIGNQLPGSQSDTIRAVKKPVQKQGQRQGQRQSQKPSGQKPGQRQGQRASSKPGEKRTQRPGQKPAQRQAQGTGDKAVVAEKTAQPAASKKTKSWRKRPKSGASASGLGQDSSTAGLARMMGNSNPSRSGANA